MENNHAGQMLREKRLALGLTQEKVAIELGMSIHQYQRYEYGEHKLEECPMRIGLRICSLLKLNPYDVIFEKIDETEI